MKQKIVLLGYMGCGKSTVGQLLAKKIDYEFIDLDNYIETDQKLSISEIFDQKGAIFFRKNEHQALLDVIEREERTVISLGGGAPCYYKHMDFLNANDHVVTVYLNVSIPVLVNRLYNEKDHRPLIASLKDKNALTEFIGKHLFERRAFYLKADIKIDINDTNLSAQEIAEQVHQELF